MQAIAVSPALPGASEVVLAGGDGAGVLRSTDGGASWSPSNRGLARRDQTSFNKRDLGVSAIAFSPRIADKVWIAANDGPYLSTDAGATWIRRNDPFTNLSFRTEGEAVGRLVGNLIAFDPDPLPASMSVERTWIGTATRGVWRTDDDGASWTPLGRTQIGGLPATFEPGGITSIAYDNDRDDLYIATATDGIKVVRDPSGAAPGAGLPFVHAPSVGAPAHAEEMAIIRDRLFVVGETGVAFLDLSTSTWTQVIAASLPPDALWQSITHYDEDPGPAIAIVVLVGNGLLPDSGSRDNGRVYALREGAGGTWTATSLTPRPAVHNTIVGTGRSFWLETANEAYMLDGAAQSIAGLAVTGGSTPIFYAAGRSAVWRSTDSGANWYPAVSGLAVTAVHEVAVDPTDDDRVFSGSSDWRLHMSDDGFATVIQSKPPLGGTGASGNRLQTLAFEPGGTSPLPVIAGVSDNSANRRGEVDRNVDPLGVDPSTGLPRPWTTLGLADATGNGDARNGLRPLDIAVAPSPGGTRYLASVLVESGSLFPATTSPLWHGTTGSGGVVTWTPLRIPSLTATRYQFWSIVWMPGSPDIIYGYDLDSGIWRYTGGITGITDGIWRNIVPISPVETWGSGSGTAHFGYLAASADGQLFASVGLNKPGSAQLDPGLYVIPGASTGLSASPVALLSGASDGTFRAGPIAVSQSAPATVPSIYFAYSGPAWASTGSEVLPHLARIDDVDGDWTSGSTTVQLVSPHDTVYQSSAYLPSAIAVDSQSTPEIYVALQGNGVIRTTDCS